jgi:hypothetical protein
MNNTTAIIYLLNLGMTIEKGEHKIFVNAESSTCIIEIKDDCTQTVKTKQFPFVADNKEYQDMAIKTATETFVKLI